MGEFFHGWRRNVGCFVLVMASAFVGMWARSICLEDEFNVVFHGRPYSVFSSYGALFFCPLRLDASPRQFWVSQSVDVIPTLEIGLIMESDCRYSTSYIFLTSGLTMLSAYLILWKPRKAGAGQKCEPSAAETPQPSLTNLRGK